MISIVMLQENLTSFLFLCSGSAIRGLSGVARRWGHMQQDDGDGFHRVSGQHHPPGHCTDRHLHR
jgi:hypothetical protein